MAGWERADIEPEHPQAWNVMRLLSMKQLRISFMEIREQLYDDPQSPPAFVKTRAFALFQRVIAPTLRAVEIWNASPVVTPEQGTDRHRVTQLLRVASNRWAGSDIRKPSDLEAAARHLLAEPTMGSLPCECRITTLLCQAVHLAHLQQPGVAARCFAAALVLESWIPEGTPPSCEIFPSIYEKRRPSERPSDFLVCCVMGELSDLPAVVDPLNLIDRIENAKSAVAEANSLVDPLREISAGLPEGDAYGVWGANLYRTQYLLHKRLSSHAELDFNLFTARFFDTELYQSLDWSAETLRNWSVAPNQTVWSPDDLGPRILRTMQLEAALVEGIRLAQRLERTPRTVRPSELAGVARHLQSICLEEMKQVDLIPQPLQGWELKQAATPLAALMMAVRVLEADTALALNFVLAAAHIWAELTPGIQEEHELSWPRPQWAILRDLALYRCLHVLLAVQFSYRLTPHFAPRPSVLAIPSAAEIREVAREVMAQSEQFAPVTLTRGDPSRSPASWWHSAQDALWAALLCPLALAAQPECLRADCLLGQALEGLADFLEQQH
ncbi:hypothetical protein E7T06_10060 [Deinococcus sp. Arct2-2]|uniref:hypothetical protein n=1 Tax=Deinococcus sp. Arct2-2 TaxID=2568653 RepID=UPI0010A4BCAF|nr:hypothetical protein [Deinococcus sp. Arct2-2]THF69838.1 hypothetical protein E7T06_10060 [Deinococcus sp. Arct2-2]